MRSIRAAVAALLIVVLAASPALACKKDRHHGKSHNDGHTNDREVSWDSLLFRGVAASDPAGDETETRTDAPGTKDLSAYQGLGSWIDIFNSKPWSNPGRAVRIMHRRGAEAIFLQTSTYGQGTGIYDEGAIDAYLHHAHRRGMKVVAWYVPAFDQQKVDFRRIRRAIEYRSPSGERFDSFGLDIEATNVGNVAVRNQRLLSLSKRIRALAGPNYPLGAITPDPVEALYWPNFPYKELASIYDVFVPMGYFSFRASGFKDVHDYTKEGIRRIRRVTGDPDVPIHFIGGIADDVGRHELKGFVKAARDDGIAGASLYDYPITSRESWFQMRALDPDVALRRRVAAAERNEAGAEKRRLEREKRQERAAEKRNAKKDEKKSNGKKNAKKNDRTKDEKNGDRSKKRSKKKENRREGKTKKSSKERRKTSSSASRRDKESSPEGERERPRRHSLGL